MPERNIRMVATSKGATLATEAWGEAERGSIVLVMGASASMVWWPETLMQRLADGGYQVIRFDLRDTGQSTSYPQGETRYDLADLEGDIVAIMDAYGLEKAHLMGMSLGGLLIQMLALHHPERVLSVTLYAAEPLGIAYEGEGISPEFMAHFGGMADLDWKDRAAVREFMLGISRLSAGSAFPFDAAMARARIETELDRSPSIESAFNHAGVDGDLGGLDLSKVRAPLLVLHGSEDPIISVSAAHKMAETVPGAELIVLERRGHEILEQDVSRIAESVLRFVGEPRA